jgi:hypothetical protein
MKLQDAQARLDNAGFAVVVGLFVFWIGWPVERVFVAMVIAATAGPPVISSVRTATSRMTAHAASTSSAALLSFSHVVHLTA